MNLLSNSGLIKKKTGLEIIFRSRFQLTQQKNCNDIRNNFSIPFLQPQQAGYRKIRFGRFSLINVRYFIKDKTKL